MINEDHVEQLAIQWHEALTPVVSHGEREHATSNVEAKN